MLLDRIREVTRKAALYGRTALSTGMLGDVRPAGLVAALHAVRTGGSGPSAIFRVHRASHPDRVAFVFGGISRTYAEVDHRIDQIATGVRRAGLRPSDRAIVMLRNRPECIEIAAALSRIGVGGVAASYRSTPAELTYLATHADARALFFESTSWPAIESALPALPNLAHERLFPLGGSVPGLTDFEHVVARTPDTNFGEHDGEVIIYTSGTTGKPKGAKRSLGAAQIAGFFSFMSQVPMRTADRHLCVCPLYHSTGIGFAAMTLMLAGTVVILPDFDPESFLHALDHHSIDTTAVVPTMLHRIMALPSDTLARSRHTSLRAMFCGGAQLPGALSSRALDLFGPVLYNFYGATETGLVTLATPADLRAVPGTIGRVLPGAEVRLLDERGVSVRAGEVGELYARTGMLVDGYHADDDATRASMRDGFFSVGDLATVDTAGRYFISGRRRDMVISGGVNVYPVEIEEAIDRHPSVAQSAVIGVPDAEWGERLRAFVVLKAGADANANELRTHLRATLSGAKLPREWVFLDAMPANPTGKVLKRELRGYDGEVQLVN